MKRYRNSFPVLFLFLWVFSAQIDVVCGSSIVWSQTFGGEGGDYAHSVVETFDGGFVIGGYTNSFRTFGTRYYDSWLVKTDVNGNVVWNQTYGLGILQSLIETTNGELVFVANNRLVKVDQNGNIIWNRTYGGAVVNSLVETSDGGFAIGGSIRSQNVGSNDYLLIKTDVNGNMMWNKTYNNGFDEIAHSLVRTFDEGYALTGVTRFVEKEDFWDFPNEVFSDYWLVKTDINGNVEWNKTYGGPASEIAYSIIQTSDEGYALAGKTASDYDILLVKTDRDGNVEWNKKFGGDWDEKVFSMIEVSDGGIALGANTNSFGEGSLDFWLVKTDTDGNVEWSKTYGGLNTEKAHSLIETSDGGYAIVGETYSFGAGDSDFWFVKTDEYGVVPEFPSWTILLLILTITLFSVVVKGKLQVKIS